MKKIRLIHRVLTAVLLFASLSHLAALNIESDIITQSKKHIGSPYQTGGIRPPAFDCSGFIFYLFKPFVPTLPRLSKDMASFGTPVKKSSLQPGDLVFFVTTSTPGAISHVALYIGNNEIIHAISDGPQRGVIITSLDSRYWKNHFHSCARILPPSKSPPAKTPPASVQPRPSPWDSWDGVIKGDYTGWKAQDEKKFENFKKKESVRK